jgi:hypothetical protein
VPGVSAPGASARAAVGFSARAAVGFSARAAVGFSARAALVAPVVAALAIAALVVPSAARAQAAAPAADASAAAPPAPSPPPRIVEVRLALSAAALKQLSEPRLRRLMEIELGDSALLAPSSTGPLGDHVAYVWVDVADHSSAMAIEVRVGTRPVERRVIADAEVTGDLAARVIAIAAAEMVRAQMRPVRPPRKPPAPKGPSPEEIEAASRQSDALAVDAHAVAAFVPSAGAWMFGPSVDVGFRRFGASGHLFGSWLTGPTAYGSARWFEVGVAASYRYWINPSLRFAAEISATTAAVRVSGARITGDPETKIDTWSARAGGSLTAEWRVHEPLWLTLGVGPWAVLRPFDVVTSAGAHAPFEGLFLGAALGILWEQRAPVHLKGLGSNSTP